MYVSAISATMDQSAVLVVAILLFVDGAMAQSNTGGLSGLAIGLIVAAVILLILVVGTGGICCFIYKRKHLGRHDFEHPEFEHTGDPYYVSSSVSHDPVHEPVKYNAESETLATDGPTAASEGDAASTDEFASSPGKVERKERFEEQLLELQPHTDTLQEMLQDVQERVKTAKHGNPRVSGYKAVSRDLSRVQHLLSKRNSAALKMPPDGLELLTWATESRDKYVELQQYKSKRDSGILSDPPELAAIMWIQSKDDSAFEDKSYDESNVI